MAATGRAVQRKAAAGPGAPETKKHLLKRGGPTTIRIVGARHPTPTIDGAEDLVLEHGIMVDPRPYHNGQVSRRKVPPHQGTLIVLAARVARWRRPPSFL